MHRKSLAIFVVVIAVTGCATDKGRPARGNAGAGAAAGGSGGQSGGAAATGGEMRDGSVSTQDASNMYTKDAGPGCSSAPSCTEVANGCTTAEVCGDGLDNDCDIKIEETCSCTPGKVQTCFAGPPGSRNVGACSDGTQRCEGESEFGVWGSCVGGISPSAETCDALDNDCNGCRDEHECCNDGLLCPGPGDPRIPNVRPFSEVVIDGASIFPGAATSWSWTIEGGPCEAILPTPTFSMESLTDSTLRFTPTLSGDYTITMRVQPEEGDELSCTFVVHVAGEGLRVELCWKPEREGTSDLDLYVHEPDTTGPWYSMAGMVSCAVSGNSCNWVNCGPMLRNGCTMLPRANWGANSPLDRCENGPGGSLWQSMGYCPNPRIDVDGHGFASEPLHGFIENINMDNPQDGQLFRIMVQVCISSPTNPVLNVYCGGFRRATIGADPDVIMTPEAANTCSTNVGAVWRAADVRVEVDAAGVTTDCEVTPIREPDGSPRFTVGDLAY